MDIVCIGQDGWRSPWTEKQQHSVQLARRGHRVLYVDPDERDDRLPVPAGLRALAPSRTLYGVERPAPSLFVFSYVHAPLLRWRVNAWRRPRTTRAVAARLGFRRPVVLTLTPHVLPLVHALEPSAVFYYAVDEMSAFGAMSEEQRRRTRLREEALLRETRAAFAVSPRLVARFREIQPRTHLLENGVDPDHFSPERRPAPAPPPALARLPRPRLGLVGQIDDRVDTALLVALARARRDASVVLVGRVKPGTDVSMLAAEPNIHLAGYHDYDALPGVLHALDVCLLPYRATPLTQACNPSKLLEYVAAGRPVVATPLEGLGASRAVIEVADGPAAFVAAVARALADPEVGRARRLALAAAHRWERRTEQLERAMREALAAEPPRARSA